MAGVERNRQAGFSLIELMMVVLIISLLSAITIPMFAKAIRDSRGNALAADGRLLYTALINYHTDVGHFPAEGGFDTTTLEPLASMDYFQEATGLTSKLEGGALTLYLAPDVNGPNTQFLAIARHGADPTIIVAIVHTNIVAAAGGWIDGVYIIDEADLADAGL